MISPLLVWLAGRSGPAVIEICSIIVSMYHSRAPIPPLPLNGVGKKYDSLLKLAIPSSRKLLQCKPSYDLVKVIQLSKPSLTNIASLQIQSLPSKTWDVVQEKYVCWKTLDVVQEKNVCWSQLDISAGLSGPAVTEVWSITVLLYHCITVLMYHCINVSLYCSIILSFVSMHQSADSTDLDQTALLFSWLVSLNLHFYQYCSSAMFLISQSTSTGSTLLPVKYAYVY